MKSAIHPGACFPSFEVRRAVGSAGAYQTCLPFLLLAVSQPRQMISPTAPAFEFALNQLVSPFMREKWFGMYVCIWICWTSSFFL